MSLLAILLAKLLDPISAVIAGMLGAVTGSLWLLPLAALAGAGTSSVILVAMGGGRGDLVGAVLLAFPASAVHAWVGYRMAGRSKKARGG
jgi:hypothetical protein